MKTTLAVILAGTALGGNYAIRPMTKDLADALCGRDHQRGKCENYLTPSVNHQSILSGYWESGAGRKITYFLVLPYVRLGISDHSENFHAPAPCTNRRNG